jgi:hypothetical protein
MRCHVTLVITDVSEESIAYIVTVKRIGEKGRVTWHHIPEAGILHTHRLKNPKSYIALIGLAL